MTFEHDEFADTMWVSISEPASPCVYTEGETAGVILRIERSTGIIRGFEVTAWTKRLARGPVLIPEISDPEFSAKWIEEQAKLKASK
ncbi:MAG: hypothetical protein PW735_11185 [Acidobacteriaceae bacterium]|nr:hypothetical protein [Acidobacteriaceae bacterium]